MTTVTSCSSIALISGHTDLSEADFTKHYISRLEAALSAGHRFMFGDAAGADTQTLSYLLSPEIKSRYPDVTSHITVCPSRKYNVSKLRELGVRIVAPEDASLKVERKVVVVSKEGKDGRRWHHIQRDANMTAASGYDILYVRSEEESKALYGNRWRPRLSATEMNRLRRAKLAEPKNIGDIEGS